MSTGFLQLLNIDRPTILLLRNFDFVIKDKYKKILDDLEKVGILHKSNQSLEDFILKEENNIEKWWNMNSTKNAKEKFVSNFAAIEKNRVEKLSQILLNSIK